MCQPCPTLGYIGYLPNYRRGWSQCKLVLPECWEVLENVKTNQDLYFSLYCAAAHITHNLSDTEEKLRRVDQVLSIIKIHSTEDRESRLSKECELLTLKIIVNSESCNFDEAIALHYEEIFPRRDRII